jgi:hypothetical protein
VELYGKIFTIVDANDSTRHHMQEVLGLDVSPLVQAYPEDSYTTYLTAKMQRETGADTTIPRYAPMQAARKAFLALRVWNASHTTGTAACTR